MSGDAPAIAQAREAKRTGFFTSMIYVGTNDVRLNIERITRRGLNGGHSAKPEVIRDIYRQSLENLPEAIKAFHRVDVYDNSGSFDDEPELMVKIRNGEIEYMHEFPPKWIQDAHAKMSN